MASDSWLVSRGCPAKRHWKVARARQRRRRTLSAYKAPNLPSQNKTTRSKAPDPG